MSDQARKIQLKKLPATGTKGANGKALPDELDYRECLKIQLSKVSAQGISVGEMRDRLGLLDSLEKAGDFWIIDAKAHERLSKEFEGEKWGGITRNIVTFIDDFVNAPFVNAQLKMVD